MTEFPEGEGNKPFETNDDSTNLFYSTVVLGDVLALFMTKFACDELPEKYNKYTKVVILAHTALVNTVWGEMYSAELYLDLSAIDFTASK